MNKARRTKFSGGPSIRLHRFFACLLAIEHVSLIKNRDAGRLCGLGFVKMRSITNEAIAALHDRELGGSRLNVQYPAKMRQ